MKRIALGLICGLILGGAVAAFAATQGFAPGAQIVSPANTAGQFPYIAGPQSTAVNSNGGTFTLNSGSAVTVANTNVTANSVIILTLKTVGGTVAAPYIATITPGTGFTVNGGGSDTSVYNYLILG